MLQSWQQIEFTEWPKKFPPMMDGIIEATAMEKAKIVYGNNLADCLNILENTTLSSVFHCNFFKREVPAQQGQVSPEFLPIINSLHDRSLIFTKLMKKTRIYC